MYTLEILNRSLRLLWNTYRDCLCDIYIQKICAASLFLSLLISSLHLLPMPSLLIQYLPSIASLPIVILPKQSLPLTSLLIQTYSLPLFMLPLLKVSIYIKRFSSNTISFHGIFFKSNIFH
ncbi:hypothetical protein GGR53DRAFT_498085 [Hypoxylon sp. FL1150]|nr:hypothetical protein GGR53DRAFT_498085 [Hypoxylon sp. FL1150]